MSEDRFQLPVPVENPWMAPPIAPAEEREESPGMSIAQVIGILRARWKQTLIVTLALVCVFAALIKVLPKSYVATATLIVNYGDRDPLASADPAVMADAFIPTQIELMQSPVVLGRVVTRLQLTSDPLFVHGYSGPPGALDEAVTANLLKAVSVWQGPGSDLLYVQVTSKQPAEAAAIANAVADEYLKIDRQRIDQPAAERARRYTEELNQLRANTIAAQDKVTAFRQQHGMLDLSPEKGDAADAALQDLQQKLLAVENSKRDLQAQVQTPGQGADASAGQIEAGTLSAKLADEQDQLAHMSATLGPRFPRVIALKSQIAATKRAIEANATDQLANIDALEKKYQTAVAEQQALVLSRRKTQDDGAKLLVELKSAEATYKKALDGYDQIVFATADHGVDVSLISSATPPANAEKPNKIKYFLMCCVLSLGVGVVLPFGYELLFDRRLRCRDDFERHFGIGVLIQLEPIGLRAGKAIR